MRAELERVVRAGWPVVAGLVLGLLAAGIWTLVQSDRYRAEARVQVRGSAEGVVPAVEALAESSLLEQNVAQTLRLTKPPAVSAKTGDGGVVTLTVEAGSRERARQIDAEVVQVLTQLVAARFGNTPVQLTVLDPAHPVEQTSPTPARNLLIGGLVGLVPGLAAATALAARRRLPVVPGTTDPAFERRLQSRVDAVAKRERALARRAGELAGREKELDRRQKELAAATRAAPVAEPQREPEPEPVPEAQPAAQLATAPGRWNLQAIETLVRGQTGADAGQYEEWNTYLFFLREHAEPDGTLPSSFDSLVNDVFGDLLRPTV